MATENPTEVGASNFIRQIVEEDLHTGKHDGRVVTRFPPEPNGYLHIGHAKSIVLNFGIARDYDGQCHLRFDDTNPLTEDVEYVESIKDAVRWLGYDWGAHLYFASDYFEQFYQYALKLIRDGKAYVDGLSEDEISDYRGTVTEPGHPSPDRDRPVEENLALFQRMRAGEFDDGEYVLRAIIDLESPNMKMRDPLLYRIKHAEHYRAGDEWPIYPMYDFAHCLEDAIEHVTHSLCTLEFDNNRELYDWVLENCLEPEELPQRPHQYEFSRLNLDYTVMSKRKLLRLVNEGLVGGWDDPRLPTIAGLRRRGVTPGAIRTFCEKIGVTRSESRVEMRYFEETVRDVLNTEAPRVMAVINPLKVTITNFPEDETDWLDADYWPRDIPKEATREVPFTRKLYIEREDFMEEPTKKFYRLAPGREVRLRYGYFITCEEVVKNDEGEVVELRCSYDPETRGGDAPDGRSPKGTIHWVSAEHALPAEIRLYDRLFDVDDPDGGEEDFAEHLNPDSLVTAQGFVEPSVADDEPQTRYQFERQGYFWRDPSDTRPDALVFNRIVPLRDTWSKIAKEVTKAASKPEPKPRQAQKPVVQRDPVEDLGPRQLERFERLHGEVGLDRDDAVILAQEARLTEFFDEAHAAYEAPQPIANWIVNELLRELKDRTIMGLPFTPAQFADLVRLTETNVINSRAAREVFGQMMAEGGEPEQIVEERGLRQIEDRSALEATVDEVIAEHPDETARYRDGKRGLIGFFMGRVMQATRGKANPELAREVLQERLEPRNG